MRSKNKELLEAIAVLKQGGIVVFPTETAYGIAADPENKRAMQRVFQVKGRDKQKQLPLIAATASMAIAYAELSPRLAALGRAHWPGPLTLVGKRAAIRVSSNELARALSKGIGRPIVSTSANLSGESTCYSVRAVKAQLTDRKHQPDFYLDAGALPRRKPSTIVAERDGELVVLRQGSVRV